MASASRRPALTGSLVLLALAHVPRATPSTIAADTKQSVRYLLRTEPWDPAPFAAAFANASDVLRVSDVDDSPMSRRSLDFGFPFLDRRRYEAYANANGAVFVGPTPPCGAFFAMFPLCTTNGSWFAAVAAFVTDLDPSYDGRSRVVAAQPGVASGDGADLPGSWTARYENVSVFGHPEARLWFAATLHGDGRVEILHERVLDSRALRGADGHLAAALLVGLRLDPASDAVALSDAQADRAKLFGTTVPGVYAGAAPRSNARVVACPVPERWCGDALAPEGGNATLRAAFFGCAREPAFEFRCAFLKGGASVGGARAAFAEAGEPGGAVEVSCALPAALVAGDVVTVELRYAAPAGDVDGGAGDGGAATETDGERALVADFPTVAVVAAGSTASGGCAAGAFTTNASACGACGACECSTTGGCGADDFWAASDCAGACSSANGSRPSYDDGEVCCAFDDADCLGVCGGGAYRGELEKSGAPGATVCCAYADCLGVCNGLAKVDRCGVCGGRGEAADACGVCFGNATAPCPRAPVQWDDDRYDDGRGDGRATVVVTRRTRKRRVGVGKSVRNHPWLAVLVVVEIVVSSLCLAFCVTQRGGRRRRGHRGRGGDGGLAGGDPWGPTAFSRLAAADLEDLVEAHASDAAGDGDAPRRGRVPQLTATAATRVFGPARRLYLRVASRVAPRRDAPGAAPRRDAPGDDVRRRVAEAYDAAVAALCEGLDAGMAGAAGDDDICAICLSDLAGDDAEPAVALGAARESDIPDFKGSDLGHFPLVLADFWTSDRLSEQSRRVDAFFGTRARGTRTLKRR